MHIRPFHPNDLNAVIDLTIETFRPYFEDYVRPLYGDELFRLHHGHWQQDYRHEIPTLNDPGGRRWIAVAEVEDAIAGYVAWKTSASPDHGEISMLVVAEQHRRHQIGRQLCLHAITEMKATTVDVVGLFTGDDLFHAPARALYQTLGFIKVPIAGYIKKV